MWQRQNSFTSLNTIISILNNNFYICQNTIQFMTGKANLKTKSKITLNFCFSYENISVAVVVAFFTCWSPFHSQRLMFVSVTLYGEWTDRLRASQHVLFMCSGIKADHWIPWCAFAPKPWFYTQNPYTKP